jgi:hypothetical protein
MRGQTTHLDTDVLADFDAGLTTGRRGARIAAHLAGCDRCRALRDDLAGVCAVLAAIPAQAMPDRVAQRLDQVLAAEVTHRNDSERSRADRPQARSSHRRPAGSRGLRLVSLRVLAPATAVVLAAAGYGLSQLAGGAGPQTASSSVAAGPAISSAAAGRANAAVPAIVPPVASGSGPAARAQRMSGVSFRFVTSQTNFMPGTLKQQAEAALLAAPSATATQPPGSVVACVREVAGSADLLLVESARYQGQAATIIVTRTSQGEVAMVAGAGCSASHHELLATATVP